MKTIDNNELLAVTGGKPADTTGTCSDSTLQALTSIQNSIKDLGKKNNNGGFDSNTMTMMVMAMALSRSNNSVVYSSSPTYAVPVRTGGGFSAGFRFGW